MILMYHFIKQFCREDNKDIAIGEITALGYYRLETCKLRNVLQRLVLSYGNELNRGVADRSKSADEVTGCG